MSATVMVRCGARRAAVLLMALGEEAAASVLGHLTEAEVEAVGVEVARLGSPDPKELCAVVAAYLSAMPPEETVQGGSERLRRLLAAGRATDGQPIYDRIRDRVDGSAGMVALGEADPLALAIVLQAEPPQAVAALLSRLAPASAAAILAHLDPEFRRVVALRLARIDVVDAETLDDLIRTLRPRLRSRCQAADGAARGVKALAAILNHVDSDLAADVVADLTTEDAELADDVRECAVAFEDILHVADPTMTKFVQRLDKRVLAIALKGASEEIRTKFFRGLSERAGQHLLEEMQFLGAVRVSDVAQAQAAVVGTLRRLVDEGAVVIGRASDGTIS